MDSSRILPPHAVKTTSSLLLRQLQNREPTSFRRFVRLYGPVVRYWIRRAHIPRADESDVFQDVFLAAYRKLAEYERKDGSAKFRAWLKQITKNKVVDWFRAAGRIPSPIDDIEKHGTDARDLTEDDPCLRHSEEAFLARRAAKLAAARVDEQTLRIAWETMANGRSAPDVAEDLGVSPAAVRKAKSRFRQYVMEEYGLLGQR